MVEATPTPNPEQEPQTLPFSEFTPEHLANLSEWKMYGEQSSRSWGLKRKRNPGYQVHIRRESFDNTHPELNHVTVAVEEGGIRTSQILNGIKSFSVGIVGEGEEAKEYLTFEDDLGGKITVRNDGVIVTERPTRAVTYLIDHSGLNT